MKTYILSIFFLMMAASPLFAADDKPNENKRPIHDALDALAKVDSALNQTTTAINKPFEDAKTKLEKAKAERDAREQKAKEFKESITNIPEKIKADAEAQKKKRQEERDQKKKSWKELKDSFKK